jgi:threonine/homoserine/homoserine lactone efflux protein
MHPWVIAGFVAVSAVAVATPGPDVILAMSNGSRFGVRRAIPGLLAVLCSDVLMIIAVAGGLGATLLASVFWFSVLKYVGAAYLLYLGLKMILTAGTLSKAMEATSLEQSVGAGAIAWRSFVVAMTNPKAYLFFAALLPQFIDPSNGLWSQYLLLTATLIAVEFAIMLAYVLAGKRLRAFFSSKRALWVERGCGTGMVTAGVSLLLIKRGPAHI